MPCEQIIADGEVLRRSMNRIGRFRRFTTGKANRTADGRVIYEHGKHSKPVNPAAYVRAAIKPPIARAN